MPDFTILHNPRCGTSRNVLQFLRDAGIEPEIIEYLQTPPDRQKLREIAAASGQPLRALVRAKEPIHAQLGLDDPAVDDEQLLDAMLAHPVLINRPIVLSGGRARLCRPSETVLEFIQTVRG